MTALGAPLGMALDAVSYVGSGLTLASIRRPEPPPLTAERDLSAELREGLTFVYRHPVLRSAALTLHLRFLFASVISTVFTLFVLRDPGLGNGSKRAAFGLGVVLAVGGVGALVGNTLSGRLTHHTAGHLMAGERLAEPIAWTLAPLAVSGPAGWAMVAGAQFLVWVALGTSGPAEMAYRQSVTPDRLQGRANATIRSLNWGMFTLGAPLGGLLATACGYRATFWIAITGMAATAVLAALSPMRTARVAVDVAVTAADG